MSPQCEASTMAGLRCALPYNHSSGHSSQVCVCGGQCGPRLSNGTLCDLDCEARELRWRAIIDGGRFFPE